MLRLFAPLLLTGCALTHDPTFTVPDDLPTKAVQMVVAVDVTAECKARFPEYLGKHPVILACAGWDDSDCTIVVGENTTHAAIGHELRHCFMGFYHD